MAECCGSGGDLMLCIASCVASRFIDKKLAEDARKWVICFVLRMWLGYAVDAVTIIFVIFKIGVSDWLEEYQVHVIVYGCGVLCFAIAMSILAGLKWQAIADNYSPKIWRLIFVLFKTTTFIDALLIYYMAGFGVWYAIVTSIVAIIDMTLCVIEILRVLFCFCDWCPCAYHADPSKTCLCFNCAMCRKGDYESTDQQKC